MSQFKRLSCGCEKCRAGCLHNPCCLAPEDLAHFDEKDLVVRTPPAPEFAGTIALDHDGLPALPVLAPAQRADGSCVFYEDGKCTVHDHAPIGCRLFNVCRTRPDDKEISVYIAKQVRASHAAGDRYAQLTKTLPEGRPRYARMKAVNRALSAIDLRRKPNRRRRKLRKVSR